MQLGSSRTVQRAAARQAVLQIFPDLDERWLADAFAAHRGQSATTAASLIVEKLSQMHGLYPSYALPSRKGKERELPESDILIATANRDLCMLAEMAPNVELALLRKMIEDEPHSQLFRALDSLLQRRRQGKTLPLRADAGAPLDRTDLIRSSAYQDAVRARLQKRFSSHLSAGQIKRAMSENCDYALATAALEKLVADPAAAPWWLGMLRVFIKPSSLPAEDLRPGQVAEPELRAEIERIRAANLLVEDAQIALKLNEEEAQLHGSLLECGCCYNETAFEQMAACRAGHLVCGDCLERGAEDIAYGASVDLDLGCLSAAGDNCKEYYTETLLKQRLSARVFDALHRRQASEALDTAASADRAETVRCAFCPNGHLEDLSTLMPALTASHVVVEAIIRLLVLALLLLLPDLLSSSVSSRLPRTIRGKRTAQGSVFVLVEPFDTWQVLSRYLDNVRDVVRLERHSAFRCPCGRATCLLCGRGYYAGHDCHDANTGLRLAMEKAMTEAVKRTCPRCGLAFTKDSGCNMTTCRCGQRVCYLCCSPIPGYDHFCNHFRSTPGTACVQCTRCELYKNIDESHLVKQAAEEAKATWLRESGAGDDADYALPATSSVDAVRMRLDALALWHARRSL